MCALRYGSMCDWQYEFVWVWDRQYEFVCACVHVLLKV